MYILIEHDGTEGQIKVASALKDYADSQGMSYEESIGSYGEPIRIYDEDLKELHAFVSVPLNEEIETAIGDIDGEDD